LFIPCLYIVITLLILLVDNLWAHADKVKPLRHCLRGDCATLINDRYGYYN